jgi:hypothetical protein
MNGKSMDRKIKQIFLTRKVGVIKLSYTNLPLSSTDMGFSTTTV